MQTEAEDWTAHGLMERGTEGARAGWSVKRMEHRPDRARDGGSAGWRERGPDGRLTSQRSGAWRPKDHPHEQSTGSRKRARPAAEELRGTDHSEPRNKGER